MATQPVVKIEDSQGNVVTASTDSITMTASSNGTVANCSNLTAVLGVVNVSGCTFGGTIGQQYTLTALSPGLASGVSAPFASNTGAGTEAGVLIAASPTSVPADNVTNVQLNFQVVDAWNNPTVSAAGTALTVSATSTDNSSTGAFFSAVSGQSGTVGPDSYTVSIPAGSATGTAYFGDEVIGSPTIQAYDPVASRTFGSAALTITPGAPYQLVYSSPPPTTPVMAGTTFPVGVVVEDQFGNVITGDSSTSVTLSASNGKTSGGFTCTTTTAVVVNGVATFKNCLFVTPSATPYVVTAAATGLTSATAPITVTAGAAAKIVVWSGNNQSARINTSFAQPLMALVTDVDGNPVSGVTVTFMSPTTNGATGKFTATAAGLCPGTGTAKNTCTAITNSMGIATSSTLTASATVGPYNVTAGIAAVTATFPEANTNSVLMFLSPVQNFSTVSTSTGTTSGSIEIQVQDPNGNPVIQTAPLTVAISYTHTGTLNIPTNPTTVTIPSGSSSANFTVAVTSATTAGTLTISAAATDYGTVIQIETVRINATATGTVSIATQTDPSTSQNAVFPVVIKSTGGNEWYSVIAVNGLLTGEVATPMTTCQEATAGNPVTISDSVNVAANRPGGSYTLDFVVESFSTDTRGTCGGTTSFFQGDGTLIMKFASVTLSVSGGSAQSTTNGTSFGAPLTALVTDSTGSPVAGVIVTFTSPTTGSWWDVLCGREWGHLRGRCAGRGCGQYMHCRDPCQRYREFSDVHRQFNDGYFRRTGEFDWLDADHGFLRRGESVSGLTQRRVLKSDRSERGASLILALVFIVVVSVIVGAISSLALNDLRNTSHFDKATSTSTALSDIANLAIQSVRYAPQAAPNTTGPCFGASTNQVFNEVAVAIYCNSVPHPGSSQTRVVTMYGCLASTPMISCQGKPLLTLVESYDDYSASGTDACTSSPGPATCGIGASTLVWTWGILSAVGGQIVNTITVGALPTSVSLITQNPIMPTATATSGDPVTITSASSSCTVSGGVVTFVVTGICQLDFNDPGNFIYAPAQQVPEQITVNS